MIVIRSLLVLMLVATVPGLLALTGCGGNIGIGGDGTDFDPTIYAGTWNGTWQTLTGGAQGPVTMVVTVNEGAKTFTVTLDLDGEVFPGTDPDPVVMQGTYDQDGGAAEADNSSLGDLRMTINVQGVVGGGFTGVPHPNVNRINFWGSILQTRMTVNFTAVLAGGDLVSGSATLNR